ncbi:hypothetical protein KH5H1_04500 [Corallococcus caeni]|nr:hypothetical protein KH5H1_04500 [Corallococcus sp. KH5-1]
MERTISTHFQSLATNEATIPSKQAAPNGLAQRSISADLSIPAPAFNLQPIQRRQANSKCFEHQPWIRSESPWRTTPGKLRPGIRTTAAFDCLDRTLTRSSSIK